MELRKAHSINVFHSISATADKQKHSTWQRSFSISAALFSHASMYWICRCTSVAQSRIEKTATTCDRPLRRCQPFTTKTFAKRAYQWSAPAVWKSLLKTVVNSVSVIVFKSRLKHSSLYDLMALHIHLLLLLLSYSNDVCEKANTVQQNYKRMYQIPIQWDGRNYTVSQKKQDTKLLPITSPNVNRFSKFFHWLTHW